MAEFHYVPTGTGVISGREVLRQTEDAINNALEDGGDTREIAEMALANSETALQQSGQAVETASAAQTTAEQAQTNAATAVSTANQANATAQTALSTAQQASTTATNAVTAAQAAQTAAENAAEDAADSEDIAAQALTSAQAAQTAAESAQTAAETAQTSAGQAASIATQAQSAAAQSAQEAQAAAAAVGASARQIGEIITSTLPLSSAGLHLLDGALIDGSGIYADFVTYIGNLYQNDPTAAYFTDETSWQASVTTYGVCGKFVYDSVNNTVRLPKLTGIIEGTTDLTALGDLVEAGLPNITGMARTTVSGDSISAQRTGALSNTARTNDNLQTNYGNYWTGFQSISLDASLSNPIYGNSATVQPQTIKCLVYIVIATVTKTEIQVDIDNIVTDLNGKADTDLLNLTAGLANTICTTAATTVPSATSARPAVIVENYKNGYSWYRVYSDGWCEQGGMLAGTGTLAKATVTLLKTFASADYCIYTGAGVNTGAFTDAGNCSIGYATAYGASIDRNTITASSFEAQDRFHVFWIACGYIS